ncbi:hypothetical protein EVG20_g7032 [Dentipellis fragilis]|uniref:Uncharacterized protein n=1 Tax=Dentipellis fragilis TaxID=205917 RepID=A0A4Y9YIG4_9AGAM|nr:hypothetical protein EVG20_g7032 [Dentipellis fragilis]
MGLEVPEAFSLISLLCTRNNALTLFGRLGPFQPSRCPPEAIGHRTYAYSVASFARTHFGSIFPALQNGSGSWHYSKIEPVDTSQNSRPTRAHAFPGALRYMLYVYCCISLVVFSVTLYGSKRTVSSLPPSQVDSGYPGASLLDSLSPANRLAKLSEVRPLPVSFEPSFLRIGSSSTPDPGAITACLWVSKEGLDISLINAWMQHWQGPISLVVTTNGPIRSSRSSIYKKLLRLNQTYHADRALRSNFSQAMHPPTTLSVHYLPLQDVPIAPNAFLNLARLFALTEHVLLVPSSTAIPPKLFTPPAPPLLKPTVLVSSNDTAISGLAWTAPRARPPHARRTGDHCMFQLWLDADGKLDVLPAQLAGQVEPVVYKQKKGPLTSSHIIHHKLGTRFHAEVCVLTLKRLEALAIAAASAPTTTTGRSNQVHRVKRGKSRGHVLSGGDGDVVKVRWLKRACREWVNAA